MSDEVDLSPAELEAAGALGGTEDTGYEWPTDPLVRENLESWRDFKLGVIIHWGLYAAIGKGGSWSLHRDRLGWFTDPPEDWEGNDADYHTWYYDQARTFAGRDFDPHAWAQACAQAGMKYCVFTTKHHDGFCMYDSQYTNLKVTSEDCPMGRDVLRELADAFRGQGMEMGAYFSKADWSRPEYWDRSRPIHDRFHNYDIAARPRAWQRFVDFTHDQIEEILSSYGPFKVLWLDAGWVCEPGEPINMPAIAERARAVEPGILVVDREVHGPYEDYRTPEQALPDDVLDYPWESCITMTKEWCSLSPNDPAKPTRELVGNLVRIVARGGNYLIGIGPDATGNMPPAVAAGLAQLGAWMDVCGEGIYGTRVPKNAPGIMTESGYPEYDWFWTSKGDRLYAFGIPGTDEVATTRIQVQAELASARILGGVELPLTHSGGATVVDLPASPTPYAIGVEVLLK